jgi:anti-anti-sigma factor
MVTGPDTGCDCFSGLHTTMEPDGARAVRVAVAGDIDLSTADELFTMLTGALVPAGLSGMHVDLSGVRLLDASGVGVLLAARNRAQSHGITFRATGAVGVPRRVLEITGVLGLLGGKE